MGAEDIEVVMPGPRAHLRGTLEVLERLSAPAGGIPPGLRAFLDRPEALPAEVSRHEATLKYDVYVNPHPAGLAWGLATSDRWDQAFWEAAGAYVAGTAPGYAWPVVEAARRELDAAAALAVGFDRPGAPPRFKIYFQETQWGRGVGTAAAVDSLLERRAPGCALPRWVDPRHGVGVVTFELHHDGSVTAKAYFGARTALGAAAGAPEEAVALADALGSVSERPGYYYLTVRMAPGAPHRYAMNRIVDHVAVGFQRDGAGLAACWREIGDLFALAGRRDDVAAVRTRLSAPHLRLVPTATAIEEGGRSVDVYLGAWDMRSA